MSDEERIRREQEEWIRKEQERRRLEEERRRTELNKQIKRGIGSGDRPKRD